jgi:hypothetical protein
MELMYQQIEQIQEDCQFVWVKFCVHEPTQEISPVDVDLTLTCKSYVVPLSVSAHGLFIPTCIFHYEPHPGGREESKQATEMYIFLLKFPSEYKDNQT